MKDLRTVKEDGLYQIKTAWFVAGYVVKNGKVIDAAPVLRRNLSYWVKRGERVGPVPRRFRPRAGTSSP